MIKTKMSSEAIFRKNLLKIDNFHRVKIDALVHKKTKTYLLPWRRTE